MDASRYKSVAKAGREGGFDAEWQKTYAILVEGNQIDHCEMFDEADLEVALARFEKLDG